MYDLLEELEALIERWESAPYTGDYTKAAKTVCAQELRQIVGRPATTFLRHFTVRELKEAIEGTMEPDIDTPFDGWP